MPKSRADYTEPLNLLVTPDMKSALAAIRFQRGARSVGEATKDLLQAGIDRYLAALSPTERRNYDEILRNVKISAAFTKDTRRGE